MPFIILVTIFILWCIYHRDKQREKKLQQELDAELKLLQQEQRNELRRKQEEKRQQIIKMITDDFAKIGWDNWSDNIHRNPEQYTRLKRAIEEKPCICQYDKKMNIAKIASTHKDKCYLVSKHQCSCPDFKDRNIPCKHMYYLAVILAECVENGDDIMSYTQDEYEVLYGLTFSLSGRGQETIKNFIIDNGGTYGIDTWRGISAVVSVDGKLTQKVSDAEFRNVPVFSPEQLIALFH